MGGSVGVEGRFCCEASAREGAAGYEERKGCKGKAGDEYNGGFVLSGRRLRVEV